MMHLRLDMEQLIASAILPKEAVDIMLCHLLKRRLAAIRAGLIVPKYHFKVVTMRKSFEMKNRVILISPQGKALCLLKTQYAKKPKNPV